MDLVLASNNQGKLTEIQQLLAHTSINIKPQAHWQIKDALEDGQSFVENALIKARHAAQLSGCPAIADDSGLEVAALNGRPGIYSARYAGAGASDTDNLQKLTTEIAALPAHSRAARFVCLMVYLQHATDTTPIIAQGIWTGQVIDQPRGDNGFGYDPIFYLPAQQCTAAELPATVKNTLSHRGQALQRLVADIQGLTQ